MDGEIIVEAERALPQDNSLFQSLGGLGPSMVPQSEPKLLIESHIHDNEDELSPELSEPDVKEELKGSPVEDQDFDPEHKPTVSLEKPPEIG